MLAIYTPNQHGIGITDAAQSTGGTQLFAKSVNGEWFEVGNVFEINKNISPDSVLIATVTIPISVSKELELIFEKDLLPITEHRERDG